MAEEKDPGIPPGTLVLDGRYKVIAVLGEGAMGIVYEARHTRIGRRIALKAVLPEYRRRSDVLQRFEHEARTGGMFQHTGIVAVYDHGIDPVHGPMLAMEFLKGVDLADTLNMGYFDLSERLSIFLKMLTALEVVHRGGIIHRDLKPENVFLALVDDHELVPKLADFGLARGHMQGLTRTGAMMGTPHYMSPEQAVGSKDIDARTDIYAMGVILYELLTGPITGEITLWGKLVTNPQNSEEELLEKPEMVDERLWRMVIRAVRRDPTKRFQSAAEFASDVKSWAHAHGLHIDERDHIAFPPGLKHNLRATLHGCEEVAPPEPIHVSLGMGGQAFDPPPMESRAPTGPRVTQLSAEMSTPPLPTSRSRLPILAAAVGAVLLLVTGVMLTSSRQTTPLAPRLERVDTHSPRGATPPVTALALTPDAGATPTPVVVAAPPVIEPTAPPTEPTPVAEAPSRGSRRRGGHSRHHRRGQEATPPTTTAVAAATPSTPTCVWETLADGTRHRVCH